MAYQQVPFSGAPASYGVQGSYKWGGKSSCGIDASTQDLSCAYTLVPQGNLTFDPAYTETAGVKTSGKVLINGATAAGLMGGIKDRGAYDGA